MKLGKLIQSLESVGDKPPLSNIDPEDIPMKALKIMTPTMEKPTKEAVFPDISIPDILDFKNLKETNESIELHSDLAGLNLDLLQTSLNIVRDDTEISRLGASSIRAHLKNIESTFPETKRQDVEYLDKLLTSDQPEVIVTATESLVKAMGSLRPIVSRGLSVAVNVHKFLEKNADLARLKTNLENSKTMLNRTERVPIEGKQEYNLLNHSEVFPKIVRAVQTGYSIDEIPDNIGCITDGQSTVPATAIAAIYQGVKKIPLSSTRVLDGRDIGTIVEFVNNAKVVQGLCMQLMDSVVSGIGQGPVNDQTLMNASAQINQSVSSFWQAIVALSNKQSGNENSTTPFPSKVAAHFTALVDGPSVWLLKDGKVFTPVTQGQTCFGYFTPDQLSDVIDACLSNLLPALVSLKAQAAEMAKKSIQVNKMAESTLSDKMKMTDVAGTAFQTAFTKFIGSLKLANSMATVATETSLNTVSAVIDISRGTGIIVET